MESINSQTLSIVAIYPDDRLGSATLTIRGSACGLNWNQGFSMKKLSANNWGYNIQINQDQLQKLNETSKQLNTLEFKTLVNDQYWQVGSNSLTLVQNGKIVIYPFFFSQKGQYKVHNNIYSTILKNTRDIVVYTPPSYLENYLKTYSDVLLMHDGQNLFNDSTSFAGVSWHCQDTVDLLVNEGQMREIIIIGVYNTADRINEYTYSYDKTVKGGGKGDLYLDFLAKEVTPLMKSFYRIVINGPSNYGILGSSLGGLISCYAGWTRPNVWGISGCMSSSFWWNSEDFNNVILVNRAKPSKNSIFYLDSGNTGPSNDDVTQTIKVRDHITQLGWELLTNLFYYLDKGGQHSEKYWGTRFHEPMTDLYPILTMTPN